MILSSAFPALNGGLTEGVADFGRSSGESDLDLIVTLPEFSGRRGHSHTQWYSLVCRLWLWCLGAGVNTSSSSVSELLSVCRETMMAKNNYYIIFFNYDSVLTRIYIHLETSPKKARALIG